MRYILISLLLTFAPVSLAQDQTLTLGNEPWPPYVLSGEKKGTAERIVCEALERAGWGCTVERGGWVEILQQASDGELEFLTLSTGAVGTPLNQKPPIRSTRSARRVIR